MVEEGADGSSRHMASCGCAPSAGSKMPNDALAPAPALVPVESSLSREEDAPSFEEEVG